MYHTHQHHLCTGIGVLAERFYLNGGTDTVTGGLGSDGFDGIYPYQQAVTITDFEDFEYVSFDDVSWGSNPQVYGFNSQNIENQFSINYDETSDNTFISISTDNAQLNDVVKIENGQFELDYYWLSRNESDFGIVLKSPDAAKKEWYWIDANTNVVGIKDYAPGTIIILNDDFSFHSDNYASEFRLLTMMLVTKL